MNLVTAADLALMQAHPLFLVVLLQVKVQLVDPAHEVYQLYPRVLTETELALVATFTRPVEPHKALPRIATHQSVQHVV